MATDPNAALNVSLEDHLVESLRPLHALLPDELAAQLGSALDHPLSSPSPGSEKETEAAQCPPRTIPYSLLSAVARWARTQPAQDALAHHDPPLDARDYSMVALLAGTRTSPERRFPLPAAPAAADAAKERSDRRARVLLALSTALIVASSEAILYLIWEDRRAKSKASARARHGTRLRGERRVSLVDKKDGDGDSVGATGAEAEEDTGVVSASATDGSGTARANLRERPAGGRPGADAAEKVEA
ncbi:uncharacterized protein BXZ73DRAFT_98770 [Epithele typhae]|uniref:uncharacterized protein n=1 Tax=Epithele typhae TaxID=378194 RepID=UPI002008236F|nr:uncharacterized protein BXZ73DRAFT_98770 [Epithele typhae]KAH9940942.1 hypothetical protein BXZ73DRAFT_98770 [Epithele typhae]